MSSDYNDIDKLLSHMHMTDFSYRSFKRGETSPALRVVRSADVVTQPVVKQPAQKADSGIRREPVLEQPARVQPEIAVAVVSTGSVAAPVKAAPAELAAPVVAAQATSPRVSDTMERLMRGSIADSAPKVNLHLELPLRPSPQEVIASQVDAERSIKDVLQRLNGLAVLPPKTIVRGER